MRNWLLSAWHWLLQRFNRSNALFFSGVLGVAHETLIQHVERPTLLILFAAMMGLPAFLSSTEVFPREDDKDEATKPTDKDESKDQTSD